MLPASHGNLLRVGQKCVCVREGTGGGGVDRCVFVCVCVSDRTSVLLFPFS